MQPLYFSFKKAFLFERFWYRFFYLSIKAIVWVYSEHCTMLELCRFRSCCLSLNCPENISTQFLTMRTDMLWAVIQNVTTICLDVEVCVCISWRKKSPSKKQRRNKEILPRKCGIRFLSLLTSTKLPSGGETWTLATTVMCSRLCVLDFYMCVCWRI